MYVMIGIPRSDKYCEWRGSFAGELPNDMIVVRCIPHQSSAITHRVLGELIP